MLDVVYPVSKELSFYLLFLACRLKTFQQQKVQMKRERPPDFWTPFMLPGAYINTTLDELIAGE